MEIIQKVVEESGLQVKLILKEEIESGSDGTYNIEENAIEIGTETLKKSVESLKKNHGIELSVDTLAEMVTAHELAHANDPELPQITRKLKRYMNLLSYSAFELHLDDLKRQFKAFHSLVMKREENAWNGASSFLLHEIDEELFEAYRDYCLNTYIIQNKDWYRSYIMTSKLSSALEECKSIFPNGITFHIDFANKYASHYNQEDNQMHIHLKNILRWKRKEYQRIKRVDYLLFQSIMNYLEKKYEEQKNVIEEREEEAFQDAIKGVNYEKVTENLQIYRKERMEFEYFLLKEASTVLSTFSSFKSYREVKINLLKESIKKSFGHCEKLYEIKTKRKETA